MQEDLHVHYLSDMETQILMLPLYGDCQGCQLFFSCSSLQMVGLTPFCNVNFMTVLTWLLRELFKGLIQFKEMRGIYILKNHPQLHLLDIEKARVALNPNLRSFFTSSLALACAATSSRSDAESCIPDDPS